MSLCFEIARAAALSVALAQPPSGDWLAKSRVEVRRSDHEYVERMVNDYRGFADGPSQEALFVARGIAESETFFKARDYAAAENRLRATLQGSSDNDPYLRWMLAEKLFLQKRFAECREVLAPVVHPVWDEPPLLIYAISCLQTGTDNLDIRRYIRKQSEYFDQFKDCPGTLPDLLRREDALAAAYLALARRESSRYPLTVECYREAHRLLPRNPAIAIGLAVAGHNAGETPAWCAALLKSVLPDATGTIRRRVLLGIRTFDPTFRDGNS
ncbi:MAG: tetratricopeptide repeat protein [Fimbriimonadaceae bacterium]|nr:tetratricopeptide repeat protein [Fimbriimonadaceae bacterium]